ncbi:hypothetical protein [Rhodopirellula europaea]|uniref:Uncharacterized protein n=1 Tax=Rhodopirellula europaea 6C TaxID=1263867 RepID=M2B2Q9_9BACT|nr:hypothetical protein [Rhodopirellula europaea]EMB16048.1 hypothetical protein RE6C_03214 [Rhodopirellula europaea 6C]|tara:strand:- start:12041 stop:12187 length:147 start_codon:yes stop_codon:yes gene_type:complete
MNTACQKLINNWKVEALITLAQSKGLCLMTAQDLAAKVAAEEKEKETS